jgi:hypothetical protein
MLERRESMRPALHLVLAWCLLSGVYLALLWPELWVGARSDEADYLARGAALAQGDWLRAWGDAYRPPLYPLFVAAFAWTGDTRLWCRVFQILFQAAIPLLLWRAAERGTLERRYGRAAALLFALWPPFLYCAPIAMAETLSFGLLALLMLRYVGAPAPSGLGGACVSGLWIAALCLLKANNVLALTALASAIWARAGLRASVRHSAAVAAFTLLGLSPWLAFTHQQLGRPVLTSTLGVNLLIGTGTFSAGMVPDRGSLPERYALRAGLRDHSLREPARPAPGPAAAEWDARLSARAWRAWQERPIPTATYALFKLLHSYGFSLRFGRDALLALGNLLMLAALAVLVRLRCARPLVAWHVAMLLSGVAVNALFLGRPRFQTFYFQVSGLALLACALVALEQRRATATRLNRPRLTS